MKEHSKQNKNSEKSIDNAYFIEQTEYLTEKPKPLEIDAEIKSYNIDINNSLDREKDWNAFHAYQAGYFEKEEAYPTECNLINKLDGWAIHKQEKGTYSCIGYAVSDLIYWHFVQKGYEGEPFSARFNWMAAKEIDEFSSRPTTFIDKAGSTLKAGLDVARKYGSVPDFILPTKVTKNNFSFKGTVEQFYSIAARYKINSYYNLLSLKERGKNAQINIWKRWIYKNGPILVRINLDDNWNLYKEGRIEKYKHNFRAKKHAALIVGYDEEGFLLRNSWGVKWGEQGYIRVSEAYAFEAFDEAYGVALSSHEDVGFPPIEDADEESWWDWLDW